MSLSHKQLQLLRDFGLTENQINLYTTSLANGILSALELSRLTKLNRQQVYTEAEKLIELGLYDITRKNNKRYIPAPPSALISLGENKINDTKQLLAQLRDTLPSLEKLQNYNHPSIVTKLYEGKGQIKKGYLRELEQSQNTEIVSIAGSLEDMFTFLSQQWWQTWNKQFAASNSTARMLAHNTQNARAFANNNTSNKIATRFLNTFDLTVNIDVFNNTTYIVSVHDKLGIWIDSPMIAHSYRILFNALWNSAEE